MYCEEWKGYGTIAKELGEGISHMGVRGIVKRLGLIDKRNPKTLFKTYKQNKRTGQYKLF